MVSRRQETEETTQSLMITRERAREKTQKSMNQHDSCQTFLKFFQTDPLPKFPSMRKEEAEWMEVPRAQEAAASEG
jgi:transcriptional regulator of met regulon